MQISVGAAEGRVQADVVSRADLLSERQIACLVWAQEGKSARDIGQILGISGRTVEKHLAKACATLGVRTRVQAVVRALDLAILRSGATPG